MINDGRSKEPLAEVTLHETKNNRRATNWDPRRDAIPTFVNDEGAASVTNDDDDLVDVARNPYSSIKSVYFPPNLSDPLVSPCNHDNPKKPQRVSTDVEILLKIDHELGPLRYQYSEIIGKTRALGLSDAGFNLDASGRLKQPDAFVQSSRSPSSSDYFPDRGQTYLRAAISSGIANRSALVDKTSSPSTFSVVGKPTSRGSRTSWLNENGSGRRQEAVNPAVRNSSRVLASLDGSWPSGRARNSVSYFPTTNSHTFRRENVPHDRSRNGCVSNSNFQPYRKSNAVIERTTSTWDGWLARDTVDTNPTNIFSRTEYNSHRYLNRTVEDSRISTGNSFEIRRRESSVSIVEVIDSVWPAVNERAANGRSNEHSGIRSGDQSSTVVETKFASRDRNYHGSTPGAERVAKDDRVSRFVSKSIEPGDTDRGVLRAVSACASRIRVFSVNTEFRATVEKRYTDRAVSPIQHLRMTTISSATTSPSNFLAKSSIFVQQVHADSSRAEIEGSSLAKIRSVDVDKRDALANASRRDFGVQKVESRAKNPSRSPQEFRRDEADLRMTESGKTRYLRLPRAKEKITILPIVLAHDGISRAARAADVDFAIPRYAVKTAPRLSYQIAPGKFYGTSSSSSRDNAGYRRDIADSTMCLTEESADEKRRRAGETSVSHINRHLPADEDYLPSATTSVAGNPRRTNRITSGVVRKAREYRESGGQRVAKTIPGMRSTPEDFLCET